MKTRRLVQAALLLSLWSLPHTSWAQDDAYDELVASAGQKFEAEDFEGAIADFKKAYEIKKIPNIMYNIGRIEEKRGRFEQAIGYYETFVNEPDIDIDARTDALTRLKALREILDMRKRKAEEAEKKRLAEIEKNKKKVEDPVEPIEPPEPDRTLSYVLTGVGVGALVAGGAFAYLTDTSATQFEQATTLEERRAAASSGQTFALTSDALLVAGGALTILGIASFFLGGGEEASAPTTLLIAPTLRPDGAGVGMHWSF